MRILDLLQFSRTATLAPVIEFNYRKVLYIHILAHIILHPFFVLCMTVTNNKADISMKREFNIPFQCKALSYMYVKYVLSC